MHSEHIKTVIQNYLQDNVDYALLINGSWGSGKTYFWTNDLVSIIEQNTEYKPVYLTLNGIKSLGDLERQFFTKLIPYLQNDKKGWKKNTINVFRNLTTIASNRIFKVDLTDIFRDVSINIFRYEQYVFCFDDLERCQIPIKELLGFINNFVEHKNLKAIILADEKNIDDKITYAQIKEKLIGRVFTFNLQPVQILPELYKKHILNREFFTFLTANNEYIRSIITEYNQSNIRIINFYLDNVHHLFASLKDEAQSYIEEILLFTALISFEFKFGRLQAADYNDFKRLDAMREIHFSRVLTQVREQENDSPKKYAVWFYEQYFMNNENIDRYRFYPSIYKYVLSGYLDKNNLKKELTESKPQPLSQHEIDYNKLIQYKFRDLEDDEFSELFPKVKNAAENGLFNIYQYVQLADFFFFFSDNKLIDDDYEEIKRVVSAGLQKSKQRPQIDKHEYDNLMHFRKDNSETEVIKAKMSKIHKEIEASLQKDNDEELIQILKDGDLDKLKTFFQENAFSKTFVANLDIMKLSDILVTSPNKVIATFTELLYKRYDISNIGKFLADDIGYLQTLEAELAQKFKQASTGQPKKFLLESLLKELNSAYVHLEETKEKVGR